MLADLSVHRKHPRTPARRPALSCAGLVVLLTAAGCGEGFDQAEAGGIVAERLSEPRTPQNSPPAPRAAGAPARRPAVAFVNGHPIERRALIRTLVQARGLGLLQQMMLREVARQEAERRGLRITPDDIDREYEITLRADQFNGADTASLTPARREKLIDDWTRSRGVPREELAVAMERNAYLRRIVAGQVDITEEMLRREYRRLHSARVEVRHIQLAARRVYAQIRRRLEQGDRFEDLVADYSQNVLTRLNQGRMPPFSADDPTVPAIFAKVAFELEPGQVSNPFEAEGSYHVLKLERRIPPDATPFEDLREKLRTGLHARLVARRMEALARRLLLDAKIRIEDRTLREQYRRGRADGLIEGPALRSP